MSSHSGSTEGPEQMVEVFWRPGCPYCAGLRRGLRRRGVTARWRNIWADEQAATVVRAANGGNETVPTVRIGDRTLTNPSAAQVAALAPPGTVAAPPVGRTRWWHRLGREAADE